MKKPKVTLFSLCLVFVLALATSPCTYAEDSGPQGGANSTKSAPAPPPPTSSGGGLLGTLLALLIG